MADDSCSVCGKSFRGWDPLTDGKGRYFHKKCAPKPDWKGMAAGIKKLFGDHGVDEIQFDSEDFLKPLPAFPMTLTPPTGRYAIQSGGKSEMVDLREGDLIKVQKDGKYEIIRQESPENERLT